MERIVDALIEVSIYAAFLAAGILLFRALFRKRISPRVQYLMWMLLILRLVLPVTIESGFHIPDLFPEAVPAAHERAALDSSAETSPGFALDPPYEFAKNTAGASADGAAEPERMMAEARKPIEWRLIAFWVWAAGVMLSVLWMIVVKVLFYGAMQRSLTDLPRWAYRLYDRCCEELHVKPMALWPVESAISPGIAFFGGPVLLMPAAMREEEKLRFAFLHELTHRKNGDHLMTELLNLLRAVYWFHPIVHLSFHEMRADMETACDAAVIARIGREKRGGYLTAVLELFHYDIYIDTNGTILDSSMVMRTNGADSYRKPGTDCILLKVDRANGGAVGGENRLEDLIVQTLISQHETLGEFVELDPEEYFGPDSPVQRMDRLRCTGGQRLRIGDVYQVFN